VAIGGNLTVTGEVTAQALRADQTFTQATYEVFNVSATHLTTQFLTVTGDSTFAGPLTAQLAVADDLFVVNALTVEGVTYLDRANITGTLRTEKGLTSVGDVVIESSLAVAGALSAASLTAPGRAVLGSLEVGELVATVVSTTELSAASVQVSGASVLGSVVANGRIEALEGLTSPRDIVTTGDGIIATTGAGEMVSRGLFTAVGGLTSPSFIATTDNATIFCSGALTVNASVAIMGNTTIAGSTVVRGPTNMTSLHVNATLTVAGQSSVNGLTASGLIAGNAGVAATSLVSAHLTLNSLVVTGLINASAVAVDTAIWTPALRYSAQPVLFSGYSDIYTGKPEACSLLC
jgi:hypothetical protein